MHYYYYYRPPLKRIQWNQKWVSPLNMQLYITLAMQAMSKLGMVPVRQELIRGYLFYLRSMLFILNSFVFIILAHIKST